VENKPASSLVSLDKSLKRDASTFGWINSGCWLDSMTVNYKVTLLSLRGNLARKSANNK